MTAVSIRKYVVTGASKKMCCFCLQVQAPLLDSLTLKMEKLKFFKTLVTIYLPAWHNVPELISACVVNNTTVVCLIDVIFLDKKLYISAGSGHHQFLSFDSFKIILFNSRGGEFDEEISTSKPLLEHSTYILGVWLNHVIIQESITLYYQKQKQET